MSKILHRWEQSGTRVHPFAGLILVAVTTGAAASCKGDVYLRRWVYADEPPLVLQLMWTAVTLAVTSFVVSLVVRSGSGFALWPPFLEVFMFSPFHSLGSTSAFWSKTSATKHCMETSRQAPSLKVRALAAEVGGPPPGIQASLASLFAALCFSPEAWRSRQDLSPPGEDPCRRERLPCAGLPSSGVESSRPCLSFK